MSARAAPARCMPTTSFMLPEMLPDPRHARARDWSVEQPSRATTIIDRPAWKAASIARSVTVAFGLIGGSKFPPNVVCDVVWRERCSQSRSR